MAASIKVLDRFIEKLEELRALGDEAARFETLVGRHEAKVLRDLLRHLLPVMPYLDAPIATREVWAAPDRSESRQTHHYKEPGLVLVNNFESTVNEQSGEMRHSGYKIALMRSGRLIQLDRVGSWSEDQKNGFWSCEAQEIDLDAEFAARHLTECVASIATALERAIERQRTRREALRARLGVLRAIQALLESETAAETKSAAQTADDDDDGAPDAASASDDDPSASDDAEASTDGDSSDGESDDEGEGDGESEGEGDGEGDGDGVSSRKPRSGRARRSSRGKQR